MLLKDQGAFVPTLASTTSSNFAQLGRQRFKVIACVVIAIVRLQHFYQKRSQHDTKAPSSTGSRGNVRVINGHFSQPTKSLSRHRSRIPIPIGHKSLRKAHHQPKLSTSTQPHPLSPPTKNIPLARQLPVVSTNKALSRDENKPSSSHHTSLHTPSPRLASPFSPKWLTSTPC